MRVKTQRCLKNEIICRSQVSKSTSISKEIKFNVKTFMSCAKKIELDYERKKLKKDTVVEKIQCVQTEFIQHKNKIVKLSNIIHSINHFNAAKRRGKYRTIENLSNELKKTKKEENNEILGEVENSCKK